MTMTTRIRVLNPVDVHEFFRYGQSLLAERDEEKRPVEQQVFTDIESAWNKGAWRIANQLGQNLPGIWDVDYRPGAALNDEDEPHNDDCDEDCSGNYHDKTCFLEASIDTSYSYSDEYGGVGELHAWFVAQLVNWLSERSVGWEFYNESRGQWYSTADELVTLCTSGAAAADWMRNLVLPAIQAQYGEVK
jgi:hypothetical protein